MFISLYKVNEKISIEFTINYTAATNFSLNDLENMIAGIVADNENIFQV